MCIIERCLEWFLPLLVSAAMNLLFVPFLLTLGHYQSILSELSQLLNVIKFWFLLWATNHFARFHVLYWAILLWYQLVLWLLLSFFWSIWLYWRFTKPNLLKSCLLRCLLRGHLFACVRKWCVCPKDLWVLLRHGNHLVRAIGRNHNLLCLICFSRLKAILKIDSGSGDLQHRAWGYSWLSLSRFDLALVHDYSWLAATLHSIRRLHQVLVGRLFDLVSGVNRLKLHLFVFLIRQILVGILYQAPLVLTWFRISCSGTALRFNYWCRWSIEWILLYVQFPIFL